MVPAHVNPPSHASSSPRATERSFGSNEAIASSDSSITSASAQPPIVTAPSMRPCALTHIFAPSFFGLVPRVATSVAMATRFSSFPSLLIWSKTSSIVALQNQVSLQRSEGPQVILPGGTVKMAERRLQSTDERLESLDSQ